MNSTTGTVSPYRISSVTAKRALRQRRRIERFLAAHGLKVDYDEAVGADDLRPVKSVRSGVAVLLAVYDGKNAVTVPVKIQFDDGDVMECGLWVMAEGATMYVPVPKEAEGCTPRRITGAAGVDVTYIVTGKRPEESTEESAEESEEVSEEASETVSEAASATESTGKTEETDSSVAIWLICIGVVLVCGGVVAFLKKRK